MDAGERRDRAGQGMQAGMQGWARASFGARSQPTLTTSTFTTSAAGRACPHVYLRRVAGGRWELAAAPGRGEARAGAAGSVDTAGGLVVHGGAGGAATVRDQAHRDGFCAELHCSIAFARTLTSSETVLPESTSIARSVPWLCL